MARLLLMTVCREIKIIHCEINVLKIVEPTRMVSKKIQINFFCAFSVKLCLSGVLRAVKKLILRVNISKVASKNRSWPAK
jgi:hypothetical protein